MEDRLGLEADGVACGAAAIKLQNLHRPEHDAEVGELLCRARLLMREHQGLVESMEPKRREKQKMRRPAANKNPQIQTEISNIN